MSPDGVVWTAYPALGDHIYDVYQSVAWTGSQFVAVGVYNFENAPVVGAIFTSPDGVQWTQQDSGHWLYGFGVTWTGSQLVEVGSANFVLTSPDGVTWTRHDTGLPSTAGLSGVTWTGSIFVAVGAAGAVVTSPDGVTWTQQSSGTSNELRGVAKTGAQLVAVGYPGAILTSPCASLCSVPTIIAQPQGRTIASGQSATLSVTATGDGPFTYHWYQGPAGVTSTPVGINSSTFTTEALTATTSYWVRINNACDGVNSASATVSVICTPPSITSLSLTVSAGRQATMSAGATGSAPLSYQWYQGASGDASTPVGGNASSYTTSPLMVTTSYWVRVTNGCGHVDSAAVTASIGPLPPTITSQPQSQTIQSGTTATLAVAAFGAPPLTFQWYQGGSGDTSQPVGTNASGYTTPALTATTSYWVRVTNPDGHADSATAEVTVGPVYAFVIWVPVASHNQGKNGSQWRSDLGLLNTAVVRANIQITFHGSGSVMNQSYVPAGAQFMLTDVVGQLGGTGSGALEIATDQPLKVTARTYNQVSSGADCYPYGTQGQGYPALVASDGLAAGQSAHLAGLVENESYRANIGVVDVGSDPATVLVELHDAAGAKLGEYTVALAAGQWFQTTQPFFTVAGETAMDRGYAKVTVQSGSGVFAFASVIDNITNDPTTVAMRR